MNENATTPWETAGSSLTLRQQCFVDEYVRDFNGAQAAIRAGYSAKTARSIAWRLLTKVDIRREVNRRVEVARATAKAHMPDLVRAAVEDALGADLTRDRTQAKRFVAEIAQMLGTSGGAGPTVHASFIHQTLVQGATMAQIRAWFSDPFDSNVAFPIDTLDAQE